MERIEIVLYPAAKTVIFKQTAVLPFNTQGAAGRALRRIFYEQLKKIDKYKLLPLEEVDQQLDEIRPSEPAAEKTAVARGRALHCRGVISGEVITIAPDSSENKGEPAKSSLLRISMKDSQTTAPVWTITVVLSAGFNNSAPLLQEDKTAIEESAELLLNRLVREGAIYSTQIQTPQILSTQGGIRSARIVLRPAPKSEHASYQFLRAKNPNDAFIPIGSRIPNRTTPLILEDTDLEDATTYYYSVIAIAPSGLAAVPEKPFPITTTGAPQPVASLNATGNGLRQIVLSWEVSHDPNVTGYNLYRSESETGEFTQIADIKDRDKQSYLDRGGAGGFERFGKLADAERYFYMIRTHNKVGVESRDSEKVSAMTKGPPTPPEELEAVERLPQKVMLTWQEGADPHTKGYAVFRAESEKGPFTRIGFASGRGTLEYVDEGEFNTPLNNNTRYYYHIQSVNVVDISSTNSKTVSALTKAAPGAIKLKAASQRKVKKIELEWEPAKEPDIASYEMYRGRTPTTATEKISTVSAPKNSFVHSGLRDGSIYWYRIRAIDRDALKGEFSTPMKGETKPRPAPPKGLKARVTDAGIQLRWKANREKDIREYKIISVGFLNSEITRATTTQVLISEEVEPGEKHRFQITAIDADGLESDASTTVSVRVPAE